MARGKGEGSIYQRSSDGRWVGSIELPRSPAGKRRRSHVVRDRKADVIVALDILRGQVREGTIPDNRRTTAQFLDFWLSDVAAGHVSESSLAEYEKRIRRITPIIGHVRLAKLTTPHLQALTAQLCESLAPKSVNVTLDTLGQALRWAHAAQLIHRDPTAGVRRPRARGRGPDDTLTPDEARQVLEVAQIDPPDEVSRSTTGERIRSGVRNETPDAGVQNRTGARNHAPDDLYALWWLALRYGLRQGELLNLRWSDISDDELTVRQSKTRAGERSLPLLDDARAVLAEHRRRQPGIADSYVFHRPDGRPYSGQMIRYRWKRLLEAAGVPHRRFHITRHTAATMLLEADVPLEVVSAILGHSGIGITSSIYARVRSDLKRKGLGRLGQDHG